MNGEDILLLVTMIVVAALIAFVPALQRFRVRTLRAVHWNSLADWHQKHFDVLVSVARTLMVIVIIVCFILLLQ